MRDGRETSKDDLLESIPIWRWMTEGLFSDVPEEGGETLDPWEEDKYVRVDLVMDPSATVQSGVGGERKWERWSRVDGWLLLSFGLVLLSNTVRREVNDESSSLGARRELSW